MFEYGLQEAIFNLEIKTKQVFSISDGSTMGAQVLFIDAGSYGCYFKKLVFSGFSFKRVLWVLKKNLMPFICFVLVGDVMNKKIVEEIKLALKSAPPNRYTAELHLQMIKFSE